MISRGWSTLAQAANSHPSRREGVLLSIVIPTLNEARNLGNTLTPLQPLRTRGVEIIVVDGGSSDETVAIANPLADKVVVLPLEQRGRARQMNAGAQSAKGDVLLFLHGDSRLPEGADQAIQEGMARSGRQWGRFDLTIEGKHGMFPVIAWFINHRSRLTGIATGDQGIFLKRRLFTKVGGFPDQPLMEDVEITARLKRLGPPLCLSARMLTSGRRWEKHGVWRTIFLMWRLRYQYARGADPVELHRVYYGK